MSNPHYLNPESSSRTAPSPKPARCIRPFRDEDEAAAAVWHRAGLACYTYLPTWQAMTAETALFVFRSIIRPQNELWVGTLNEQIVGYMALNGSYIDRLYIDPPHWRQGWGTQFLQLARQLSPPGLELATHQENHAARALYERHGFVAVRFGLSPPPESAPDVEYHWRPPGQ